MDLLDISADDLAEALYIEKTSISKWKNGARSFGVDSEHFTTFSKYLIQKNLNSKKRLLEAFFSYSFPGEEENLAECIYKFISRKDIMPVSKMVIADAENRLYHTQISVYNGTDGREKALSMLLDVAENIDEPTKIFFLERNQYFGGSLDIQGVHKFIRRIEKILEMGHTLEYVVFIDEKNFAMYKSLMSEILPLAFHKNVTAYMIPEKRREDFWANIYVVPNKILVTGLSNGAKDDMLSCVYGDKFLITQHRRLIENFTHTTSPVSVAQSNKDKISLLKVIQNYTRISEPMYFAGRTLSATTMSEALLDEILDDNNFSKVNKKRGMELYHTLRANIESSSMELQGGYYLSFDEIMKPLLSDKTVETNISALAGQRAFVTREQYMEHFRDTADLLLKDPRYRVILSRGSSSFFLNSWFKRNRWNMTIDINPLTGEGETFFGENVPFINIFTSSHDETRQKTPSANKDNEQVAALFKKISEGEILTPPPRILN